MNTKKKHNSNNIISWIAIFILLASTTVIVFNYINKNLTIQAAVIFIAEILITVVFILIMLLDSIQHELYDIKNSLDNLYDIKQINDLRSTVNNRHLEKALHDIYRQHMEKTFNETYIGGKINEKNKD